MTDHRSKEASCPPSAGVDAEADDP